MSVSEKLSDVKFTKGALGYSQKEVDGFINDLFPLVKEQEQLLLALKVKLDAFEAQRDEIQGKEQAARKLLEAAKKEAEIIVATAKKEADTIKNDAHVASEVQVRAATSRAAEIMADAEKNAAETVSKAEENAEKIIRTADAEARAIIEKVKAYSAEETRKAQGLANECAAFEARFKSLVADTAAAIAAVKESAPVAPKAVEVKAPEVKKEELPKEEKEAAKKPDGPKAAQDFEIVGGVPYAQMQKKEPQKRHLYDTVQVTYDDNDFSDIRKIMENGEKRKSPTHFSE